MGSLMAKLAHDKATTYEALQNLEEKIIATEELMRNSQLRYERIIRSLVMATFFIYVLSCFVIYLYLLPSSWLELFLYNCPLLVVFPLGMAVTKKVITLYFNIKWNRYSKYLGDLQEQKKGILDQVMETENYKTARNLLERFSSFPLTKPIATQSVQSMKTVSSTCTKEVELSNISANNVTRPKKSNSTNGRTAQMLSKTLPRPILPTNGTFFEKLADYIANDGASNRYAMICSLCHNHNGMALQEEFEYLSYRCAFCGAFNQAKKTRPIAPCLGGSESKHYFSNPESSKAICGKTNKKKSVTHQD